MANKKFAVCILVFNEEKNIYNLIKAIKNQDLNEVLSIIIIASGCTDNTIPEIEKAKKNIYKNIILLREKRRSGKSHGLDICIKYLLKKYYDYAFFIDGDVQLMTNSLSVLYKKLISSKTDCVTGNPVPRLLNHGIFNRIAQENCAIWNDIRLSLAEVNEVWVISDCVSSFL